jgi:hypothetical protein
VAAVVEMAAKAASPTNKAVILCICFLLSFRVQLDSPLRQRQSLKA